MPVILSFTVETNGCLITGKSMQTVIERVDKATNSGPAYYMVINCAHPTHFSPAFKESSDPYWKAQIGGI
jgi:homocysteine S-methyltransferase